MKRAIVALCRAFLVIPFTAGTRRTSSGPFRLHDCSTSATVMFLLLLASIVVFTGSLAISDGAMQRVQVIKVGLILIDLAGVVTCVLIGHLIYKHGVQSTEPWRSQGFTSKHLQLGCLWLFAILSSVYFSVKAAVEIQCWNSFSPTQIVDSILRIILVFGQARVLQYLLSYRIEHIPLTHFAIPVLVGVNVCLWVNSFVRDKTTLNPNSPTDHNHNISDWVNCALNSTSGLLYYKSKKFILPAYVECMLLCITLLTEISSMHSSEDASNEDMDEDNCNKNAQSNGYGENTPLLLTANQDDMDGVTSSTPKYINISVICGVLVLLPNLVLHIIHALFSKDNLEIPVLLYEITMKSTMVIATIFGFYCTETVMASPTSGVRAYSTRDKVFLASVMAIFNRHCFAVMAGCLSNTKASRAVVAGNCINIIHDYFQSVFLLYVARCVRKASYVKCTGFVCICLFLAITNFGCWIVDSFIIGHTLTSITHTQSNVLKPTVWHILNEIFGPLTMYYSFSSAFAFHTLYITFSAK